MNKRSSTTVSKQICKANRQDGIALITVLVIFSVLSIMSIHILSNQNMNNRRTANIINSSKAYQYMYGAEEFAKSLLQNYFEESEQERVHRNQPWAQSPMMFPIEQNMGQLQGSIKDMHSCFNLNSIIMESVAQAGGPNDEREGEQLGGLQVVEESTGDRNKVLPGQKLFTKLIEPLIESGESSPQALATAVRDWIDDDLEPSGIDGAEDYTYTGYTKPYRTGNTFMAHTSELMVVKGFDANIYDSIKDYICVLPTEQGTINVNTVKPEHAELVWILLEDVDLATVRQALEQLPEDGYDEATFFETLGSGKVSQDGRGRLVFDSQYMQLTATAMVQTGNAKVQSLLMKSDNEFQVVARHIGD
ncbi:type II secretion system minor pseudopilin GspK [Kangiella koreensis]|uniref:Type II secretion system protein K n=1 Tax=Kangiella koreensis (strain DSM 16069 / JCM 12317 / KCTC 12182 / SW-125) TaxID=523791 RepID=C7R8F3_KANKD|nr:type II secretion system minor pseudopilin GspK [Kangiella koreensis]ACV27718.1 General secretion pathway protein K [Kangiella koreensis DSM 16069]